MTAVFATLLALITYALGYRFYSKYLAQHIFQLDEQQATPAHTMYDGVDYVPTRPIVLFGHHFASITGLAPMLGPAIAVIWGWAPAMIWVVCGSLLIGCVHDFSALVVSSRYQGKSVGSIAQDLMSPRARWLFLFIIFFGVSLAMGVFVFVIAKLFGIYLQDAKIVQGITRPAIEGYPQAVFPSICLMLIAAVSGYLLEKKKYDLFPVIAVGFVLSLISIWAGLYFKQQGYYQVDSWPQAHTWIIILLLYAFLASVLPVWSLLQPRDFLNSLLLYLGLLLAYAGLFYGQPDFAAPAFVPEPKGAPPMLPFVFILIACGAASGFHGLVSSGTTAKQLNRETDARAIGYGGMIGESLLGLLAVLACTAGFRSSDLWHQHYHSFDAAKNLGQKLSGFIEGCTHFLSALHLPSDLSSALIAMVVVSFALTTLDSATRLLRFNLEEIFAPLSIPILQNRYVSSMLACSSIAFFAFYKVGGKPAALALWSLFGTTNQLLAGLTLSLVTLYLSKRNKNTWVTGIPAVFMLTSTFISMSLNLYKFLQQEHVDYLLIVMASILMLLGFLVVFEAVIAMRKKRL
jgi:carbon starvation protein